MVLKKVRAMAIRWDWWHMSPALLPLLPLRSLCYSCAWRPAGEELQLSFLAKGRLGVGTEVSVGSWEGVPDPMDITDFGFIFLWDIS